MNTLTQTAQSQQLTKEAVTIGGASFEVDLNLANWEAVIEERPTVTYLAELYSTDEETTEDGYTVPCWSGLVACTLDESEASELAVAALIRSHQTLSAERYSIGSVWKPETEDEF